MECTPSNDVYILALLTIGWACVLPWWHFRSRKTRIALNDLHKCIRSDLQEMKGRIDELQRLNNELEALQNAPTSV